MYSARRRRNASPSMGNAQNSTPDSPRHALHDTCTMDLEASLSRKGSAPSNSFPHPASRTATSERQTQRKAIVSLAGSAQPQLSQVLHSARVDAEYSEEAHRSPRALRIEHWSESHRPHFHERDFGRAMEKPNIYKTPIWYCFHDLDNVGQSILSTTSVERCAEGRLRTQSSIGLGILIGRGVALACAL